MKPSNPWLQVDEWRLEQGDVMFDRLFSLIRLGWLQVATNDGTFGARRIRPGDEPGAIPHDAPEVSAPTWEQLFAEVQARSGKHGGAA